MAKHIEKGEILQKEEIMYNLPSLSMRDINDNLQYSIHLSAPCTASMQGHRHPDLSLRHRVRSSS